MLLNGSAVLLERGYGETVKGPSSVQGRYMGNVFYPPLMDIVHLGARRSYRKSHLREGVSPGRESFHRYTCYREALLWTIPLNLL